MTHVLGVPILDINDNKDYYRVFLTRDAEHVSRNSHDDKELAKLEGGWCEADAPYDPVFLDRLTAYINSTDLSVYNSSGERKKSTDEAGADHETPSVATSMWDDHSKRHLPFLHNLKNGESHAAYRTLNRMYQSAVMHGITQGDIDTRYTQMYPGIREIRLKRTWDILLGICEYVGIVPPQNHEQGASYLVVPIVTLIRALEAHLRHNFQVPIFEAPPWQGGQWCLHTECGLFGDRDLIALYLAMKIAEKFPERTFKIAEIGGGSGFVAYWLYLFGYRNITMVDLPIVACCQAFQLKTNLPDATISLPNERDPANIKFLDAQQFIDGNHQFDLVINCDSLPEMSLETVHAYLDAISRQSQFFYSINQESRAQGPDGRQHSIRYEIKQHFRGKLVRADRSRFWLRDGYTEEWYGVVR